jgi:hypothetical protein
MNPFRTPATFLSGDGLRVWTNPNGRPNFIVLLHSSLYTATIPDAKMATAIRDLSAGQAPQAVMGEDTREIGLLSISRAVLNMRDYSLEIRYFNLLGNATARMSFPYREDLDEIQGLLQRQLGTTIVTEPLGFSLWHTLGGPLLVLAISTLLFMYCWTVVAPANQLSRVYAYERFLQDVVGQRNLIWSAAVTGSFILLWACWRVLTRPVGVRIRKVIE